MAACLLRGAQGLRSSRRFVVIGVVAVLGACASPRGAPQRVLFVCLHGTVKSPIAREHLRRLAAERGIALVVESRGLDPVDDVSPTLAAALRADGIDPRREEVRRLTAADIAAADIIIAFNPLPAEFGARMARDWSDVPSMNANYSAARAALIPRLEAVLDEIAANETQR